MNALTVGSLFAGIGGFDLGLERAGMRVLWQCEIDPYCQRVLAKHWPDVLRVPDIRDVRAGTVPAVDVLCGGFPCPGFSNAGLRLGFADPRSALWFEMLRVVRELRPRYVIVENVAALVSRGLGEVLGGLAACGYDAEWDCIPASAVGAPHRRDRVWIVAYPDGRGLQELRERDRDEAQPRLAASLRDDAHGLRPAVAYAQQPRLEGRGRVAREPQEPESRHDGPLADAAWHVRAEQEASGAEWQRVGASSELVGARADWWLSEPDVGRVAHGIPARVDRLGSLGNALVPQIAEWIGQRIIEWERDVRAAA